ncbi:ARM repeat-containing protein [Choiromyces venosus 120613-1]|uniref:ARM repeat-containing protein n=1 Tax=Choiromyces venosus 120613-1 TaxID=1336337 RepID=A0A3N4KE92_9PEZI|nr:ARM repeat-containing protein [Choiromyces venosus 120613-1]
MSDETQRQVFKELKPHCIKVSETILKPTQDPRALTTSLTQLLQTLTSTSARHVQVFNRALGDYVFYPLSHIFRQHQTVNDSALEKALACVRILLNTCWRLNMPAEQAKQMLIMITFVIAGVPGAPVNANRSEETKVEGMKCLLALFECVRRTEKGVLGDVESLPALGHSVTAILEVAISTGSVQLQIVSLEVLEALLFSCVTDLDIFASFYPGVVSGLAKVIGLGPTTKRPYEVLVRCVKVLDRVICKVLGDRDTAFLPTEEENKGKGKEGKNEDLKVHRTTSWLTATATQTKSALDNILRLRGHPHSHVRRAVFELCRDLLETCGKSLAEARTAIIETLIVLSGDEDDSLKSISENTLRVAAMSQNIKEVIQSCVHGWALSLPRVMAGNEEIMKTRLISRISTGFRILTELGMDSEILQETLATNIRDSLFTAYTGAAGKQEGIQAVEEPLPFDALVSRNTSIGTLAGSAQYPDVVLGHRSQRDTVGSVKKLLGLLGCSSENALRLAQRHIRESSRMNAPAKDRSTSLWVAVQLLRGSLANSEEMDLFLDLDFSPSGPLQQHVTEELFAVSLSVLNDATELGADEEADPMAPTLQCLALEAISLTAQAQKESFREDLVDALYPVVHLLGSPSRAVQSHAIVTLNNVSRSCGYPSAKELILENVDYMVNAVALKLNTFDLSPQAPVVLGMMLRLAGPSLIPYLDDTVVSIFAALDAFHGYEALCEALLGVLAQVVEESGKGGELLAITANPDDTPSSPAQGKRGKLLTSEDLIKDIKSNLLREQEKKKQAEADIAAGKFPREPWGKGKKEGKFRDKNADPTIENENEDEEDPPPPPTRPETQIVKPTKTYDLVQRITRLSQHYLTHPSYPLRLKLLRLISTASPLLSKSEDAFLPLVNDIWPALLNRLFEDEPYVTVAAAEAISTLARECGDFISSRIADAWPGIKRVFGNSLRRWEREGGGRSGGGGGMGVYGPGYKVFDALCGMLATVVEFCRVGDEVVDDVCGIMGGERLALREDLKVALEGANPEAVWLEIEGWKARSGGVVDEKWALPVLKGFKFYQVVF